MNHEEMLTQSTPRVVGFDLEATGGPVWLVYLPCLPLELFSGKTIGQKHTEVQARWNSYEQMREALLECRDHLYTLQDIARVREFAREALASSEVTK